jgi:hypothetical protein
VSTKGERLHAALEAAKRALIPQMEYARTAMQELADDDGAPSAQRQAAREALPGIDAWLKEVREER